MTLPPLKAAKERIANDQIAALDADILIKVWGDIDHLARHAATVELQREAIKARNWLGRIVDRVQAQGEAETPFSWNDTQ